MDIKAQPGFQTAFLSSAADIVIGGGAAGAGKTFAELIECTRHLDVKNFGAVIFRRESSQIANEGGPWDTAKDLYAPLGATFVESPRYIAKFPNKVKITFSHMQLERHVKQWDGSQIPLICFDELQHFTERQFWYMLSRNRSTCGVRPYIRATCNPDPDSFLLKLLEWWIDQETGDPIPERSGKIRWFIRLKGEVIWADSKEAIIKDYPKGKPKSFTFVMGQLEDNQELLKADPDYEANIDALLDYERMRLRGNWFARPSAGELFKRAYFEIIDPNDFDSRDIIRQIRYWDRAATEVSEVNNDPDYSVGLHIAELADGTYIILDIARDRLAPGGVEDLIDSCVSMDDPDTVLGLEQEPGASGKMEVAYYERKYESDVEIHIANKTKSKLVCWKPVARYAKNHHIKVLRADWNRTLFSELEAVTDGSQIGHDDQADSLAGGFNFLTGDDYTMMDGVNVL